MLLKGALILFAICFVVACWVFVAAHQIGLVPSDSVVLNAFPIAYPITVMSFALIIAAVVTAVFKR